MLDDILKNIDDFIYLTDAETRLLLYANKTPPGFCDDYNAAREDLPGGTGKSGKTGDSGGTGEFGKTGDSGGTGGSGKIGESDGTGESGRTGEPGRTGDSGGSGKIGDSGGTGELDVFCEPGAVATREYRDASGKYYRGKSWPVYGADGRALTLTQVTDITEFRELAVKLENSRNNYLSRMSHEILTPMNAIIGMSAIASAATGDAKVKDCLTKIDEASRQLLAVINSISDISKLEGDRLILSYENVRLDRLLAGVAADVTAQAKERRQDFRFTLGEGVPAEARTDGRRLTQVLMHLLHNAVKFTPDCGAIELRASLNGISDHRADIGFIVSDTGIGIPEDKIAGLFDAFEQVDGSTSRVYGGVGLGLAIARRLVRLMGGDIRAQSEPGAGSAFSFNIVAEIADTVETMKAETFGSYETIKTEDKFIEADDAGEAPAGKYETFLPCFDAAAALQKLRGKTKLYSAMLATLKNTTLFNDMRAALAYGDFALIGDAARSFAGTAQNLCLLEMSAVLGRIETMARRKVLRPEIEEKFETAAEHIFEKLDDLIGTLNRG